MKLYEISRALENLEFVDEDGVVDFSKLEELNGKFDEKAENIACFIKNLTSDITELKEEEKALEKRRKAKENKAEALKEYLIEMMRKAQRDKLDRPRACVSLRWTSRVHVDSGFIEWAQENGRLEFLKFKEPEAKKTLIKDALKTEDIPFASIEEYQILSVK